MTIRDFRHRACLAAVLLWAAVLPALAQNVIATATVGTSPRTPALNPVTGRVYVPNNTTGTVSVIDGATNAVTPVTVLSAPVAVAVNPETNKIYVANSGSGRVSVIDGATNAVTNIVVGTTPVALAVNPRTNRVYAVNSGSNNVSVIDAANNTVIATIATGTTPRAVAVNTATNKVYVANGGTAQVTVIDGNDHSTTSVAGPTAGGAVVVNPVTNRIYVASITFNALTVIDGATNTPTTLTPGAAATALAVNPVTNRVYVAMGTTNNVAVIDGNNAITPIAVGTGPAGLSIDTTTNRVHVTNSTSNNVSIINGASNVVTTLAVGSGPNGIAANPVNQRVYAVNQSANTVSVIDSRMVNPVTYPIGANASYLVVNEVSNKVYAATGGPVVEVDGVTRGTAGFGTNSPSVAVNPRTNKIYSSASGTGVHVFDATTRTSKIVNPPGFNNMFAIAVNPVTNKIYAVFASTNNVMVIDGNTDTHYATLTVGNFPVAIAIDTVFDGIYVANRNSGDVSFFGGTNFVRTYGGCVNAIPFSIAWDPVSRNVLVGCEDIVNNGKVMLITASGFVAFTTNVRQPNWIAVNPNTGRFYVANSAGQNKITVIDTGSGQLIASVPVGAAATQVGVDVINNRIFVSSSSNSIAMVDGVTLAVTSFPVGAPTSSVIQNPVTGRVYIAQASTNSLIEINGPAHVRHVPVASLPGGNITGFSNPVVTVNVANPYAPSDPPVSSLWYRLGASGPYTEATGSGPFQVALSGLAPGAYKLSMFATDDLQGGSIANAGGGSGGTTSVVGSPVVFDFTVVTPTTVLNSVKSRKAHPGFALCDVTVDPAVVSIGGAVSIEPRSGVAGHALVFGFNEAITIPGVASVTDAMGATVGSLGPVTAAGNSVTVPVSGVPDGQRVKVRLAGVNAMIDAQAFIGFLQGDLGGTRQVSVADVAAVKARQGATLNAGNCTADLDLSGAIDARDLNLVKSRSAQALP